MELLPLHFSLDGVLVGIGSPTTSPNPLSFCEESANLRFRALGVSGRDRRLTLDHRERSIARLGNPDPAGAKD